jgi:hypothetical protein
VTPFALVVPFDDLAPVVDGLREQACATKPSHGMPPHARVECAVLFERPEPDRWREAARFDLEDR